MIDRESYIARKSQKKEYSPQQQKLDFKYFMDKCTLCLY